MTLEKINPDGLAEPAGYTQVTVAQGTKRVYVAGQIGNDADDSMVGDDLGSRTSQAFANIGIALAEAGAALIAATTTQRMSMIIYRIVVAPR